MSQPAYIRKEIRLLLPTFVLSCGLAFANVFMPTPLTSGSGYLAFCWYLFSFVACPLLAVMLALQSFGAEMNSGTFSALLAQPVPRKTIWNTKVLLLAVALLMMALFWCAALVVRTFRHGDSFDWLPLLETVGISAAVIFSGSLWTVLLLRQVAAAFWITLLIPAGIVAIVNCAAMDESPSFIWEAVMMALSFYSLAGFLFARWLFLRAQDVQWSGTNIALPEIRALSSFKIRTGALRRWSPRTALWIKEFQLHQSQFVLAGVLLLVHVAAIIARKVTPFSVSEFSSLGFFLKYLWGAWLLMPLLVGCTAAAEERRLGTLTAQLCLPASYRTQFLTKVGVVLMLSLLFGMVMPLLLEHGVLLNLQSKDILVHPHDLSSRWQVLLPILRTLPIWTPLLAFAAAVSIVGLISFYAATLAQHTLQALSLAVLGVLQAGLLCVVAANPDIYFPPLAIWAPWQFALLYSFCAVTLTVTLLILAARNLRQLNITWRLVSQNIVVLISVLGVLYLIIRLV